jgi:mRNA interferase MazF
MFRGEVWTMSLEKTPRASGGKTRPVVIVSSDSLGTLPLRVVVPLVDWKKDYASVPWMVRVPPVLNSGLEAVHAADTLQVRSISTTRLKKHLGDLPPGIIVEIVSAAGLVIGANEKR